MIVITGAAGFIGSRLVARFNAAGKTNLVLVDDFSKFEGLPQFEAKAMFEKSKRSQFSQWSIQERLAGGGGFTHSGAYRYHHLM